MVLLVAAPRLRTLGIPLADSCTPGGVSPEQQLYDALCGYPDAHSRYNALLARIVSFASAAEHVVHSGQ